ncbi:MAG: His-Xaa-Ser system radical SAM maturase HxsB [Nanoarchaeota archaeon]|nr:His-Xaa-Ser system radical SAM maturase HxsB [DPANN group archaeon]MBL7116556.1 His-Xaa-Ser system radical SAM maturase HxsB [Nanoarchaeota archaeon]
MPFSLFEQQPQIRRETDKNYVINFYHTKKFDNDHILITVDHGSWIVLNKEEFDLLRFNRLNESPYLKSILEEKGIILTQKSKNFILTATKNKYHHTWRGTTLHILVPTLRCNQKCIYCHAKSKNPSSKKYDMTKETARKVVDFIFQSPSQVITIEYQGGESFLNFEIVKYIQQYALEVNKKRNKNIRFVIVTNFTSMTKEKKRYIIDNNIDICTSVDGPKELHNYNRPMYGGGNSYDKVVEVIEEFQKEGKGMGALPTITKKSLEYPEEIVDEYILRGFNSIMSRNLSHMGSAKELWDKLGYTAEEYIDFFKKQIDYIIKINKKGVKFMDVKSRFILQRILSIEPRIFTCFGSPCGAIFGQIAYDQDGNIFTCDEARSDEKFIMGNVHTHTYKDLIKNSGSKIVDHTSCLSLNCDNCVWHPYCGTCMVWAHGSQGNAVSKLAMDYECKIRSAQTEYLFKKLIFDKEARKILMNWAFPKKYPPPYKEKKLLTKQEREAFIKSLKEE